MEKEQVLDLPKERLLDWYHQMVLIRRLEEKSAELYQQGKIGGFLHLYIGQEAVAVGALAARKPEDPVITAYRDHGVALAAGIGAERVLAELMGKATGTSRGKGGSMHLADVNLNFWGGHAIVGAHLPLATGLALAKQYRHEPGVVLCMFGDGATNIGYFHEALNLAQVWRLPVLFLCENNLYGMGTSLERASAVTEMRQKADGYRMPNGRADGMDVMAVYNATCDALDHVRAHGPYFLEAVTYRYRGHSMGDPERYRKPEEVRKWQEDDPIGRLYDHLTGNGLAGDGDLDAIDRRAEEEIAEAQRFAEESPDPAPKTIWEDVYVESA